MPGLALTGFGISFTMPAATAATIEAAPAHRTGVASGVLNAARQVGGAIGVALLGTLVAAGPFVNGMHLALIAAAAVFFGGMLVALLVVESAVGAPQTSS